MGNFIRKVSNLWDTGIKGVGFFIKHIFMRKAAIKKSIAHWERMIEWAQRRDPLERVSASKMVQELNETYGSEDCALCGIYGFLHNPIQTCWKCPLQEIGQGCEDEAGSLWEGASCSNNWQEWIYYAEKLLTALKSCLKGL